MVDSIVGPLTSVLLHLKRYSFSIRNSTSSTCVSRRSPAAHVPDLNETAYVTWMDVCEYDDSLYFCMCVRVLNVREHIRARKGCLCSFGCDTNIHSTWDIVHAKCKAVLVNTIDRPGCKQRDSGAILKASFTAPYSVSSQATTSSVPVLLTQ
ncbi:hypothetical protein CBL_00015 [Carabus blaptoides fortunei]